MTSETEKKTAKSFLNSGGARRGPKLLAWGQYRVGDSVEGIIIEPEPYVSVQTKMGSREPATWDDGSPKEQLIISIDTADPDPHIEGHDGKWGLAIRGGWKIESSKKALTLALQDNDLEEPRLGDHIKMTRLPNARNDFGNNSHQFACVYTKVEDFTPEMKALAAKVAGGDDDSDEAQAAPAKRGRPKKAAAAAADNGAWES